jgi:hypothetical protein
VNVAGALGEAGGWEEGAAEREEEGAWEHFGGANSSFGGVGGSQDGLVMASVMEMYAKDARAFRSLRCIQVRFQSTSSINFVK